MQDIKSIHMVESLIDAVEFAEISGVRTRTSRFPILRVVCNQIDAVLSELSGTSCDVEIDDEMLDIEIIVGFPKEAANPDKVVETCSQNRELFAAVADKIVEIMSFEQDDEIKIKYKLNNMWSKS